MAERHAHEQENSWSGTAFLVEALLLLALLLATLAVFVGLLSRAITTNTKQELLDRAVMIASNSAEEFSASPATYACPPQIDGLDVACDITPTHMEAGTLYEATFSLSSNGEELYELSCARYVGGGSS
jgi:hypothetical protein